LVIGEATDARKFDRRCQEDGARSMLHVLCL